MQGIAGATAKHVKQISHFKFAMRIVYAFLPRALVSNYDVCAAYA